MNPDVQEALETVLSSWQQMQRSDMDSAGEDANRFERAFYLFIDELREFVSTMPERPKTVEQAMERPEFAAMLDELPPPLHLNFETELELILEAKPREDDAKYD